MAVRTAVQLDRQRIKELTEREASRLNERTVESQRLYEEDLRLAEMYPEEMRESKRAAARLAHVQRLEEIPRQTR